MIVYARLATIEAARSLARYRLRSALASLGVAVAVATVVWVAAIGRAAIDSALAQIDALGDNLVWIEAGARSVNGVRTGTHGMNTLLPSDAQAIRSEVPRVDADVSENVDGTVQVIARRPQLDDALPRRLAATTRTSSAGTSRAASSSATTTSTTRAPCS